MLDESQSKALTERGFVNLGPLFDPGEIAQIAKEYDRLVTFEGQVLGNREDGVFPYRAMMNFRSPYLASIILHPALLGVAKQVLGENVRFWWDQGINKAPGAGSFIPWHQDNGYEEGDTQAYLTCWLALDDSTLDNGGLQVIPGSHLGGLREHAMRGAHAVIDENDIAANEAVPLDAKAGDLVLFSSLLVHQTVGNRTRDQHRRAWVIQYCRGDQHNSLTGETYDNRPWVLRDGVPQTTLESERAFDLHNDRA